MKNEKTKKGFTIIEVMLVLAISGLLLIGTLGGTYSAVRTQRYNDAVNTFAENLRQVYNEVLNPRSVDDQSGDSMANAIYGKAIVFGSDEQMPGVFYTATLVGDAALDTAGDGGFLKELGAQNVSIKCDTVSSKSVLWEGELWWDKNPEDDDSGSEVYSGTIIIARSPRSGAVHTAVYDGTFDIGDATLCRGESARLKTAIRDKPDDFNMNSSVTFCIKSDEASVVRGVKLAANGANSSAVSILTEVESREAGCK